MLYQEKTTKLSESMKMWILYIWTAEKQRENHSIKTARTKIQASWDADLCDTGASLWPTEVAIQQRADHLIRGS